MIKRFILLILLAVTVSGCKPSDIGMSNSIPGISPPPDASSCEQPNTDVNNVLSNIFYFVMNPISTQITSVSVLIFTSFTQNPTFKNIIQIMLTLYVAIYGVMFMFGMTDATATDLVTRLLKIGVLLVLTTGGAYDFFNKYLFTMFTSGSTQLIDIVTNPYCATGDSAPNIFAFTAYTIHSLFTLDIFMRMTAMLVTAPLGWLCFALFALAMLKYFLAILKAIIAYILAFTAVAFLISLGPIFIALILFDKTREFFQNWWKLLLSFALQPVLMFAGIFIVSLLINQMLHNILRTIVWCNFLDVYIDLGAVIGKWDLFDLAWYVPDWACAPGVAQPDGSTSTGWLQSPSKHYLIYLADIVILYLFTDLVGKIPAIVEELGSFLTGGHGLSGGGGGVQGIASGRVDSAANAPKAAAGQDKGSKERRAGVSNQK